MLLRTSTRLDGPLFGFNRRTPKHVSRRDKADIHCGEVPLGNAGTPSGMLAILETGPLACLLKAT